MAKNYFTIYYDYKDALTDLTDEQVGKLFRAIFDYEIDKKEPNFTGELKIAFKFIRNDLDTDLSKYESICERNKENGKKGGRPKIIKNPKNPSGFSVKTQNPVGFLGFPNNDINIINTTSESNINKFLDISISKDLAPVKIKKRYGNYSNILLTDDEYSSLIKTYGEEETTEAIQYLDDYVEMKGVEYKSHYLALRKWVFKAIQEPNNHTFKNRKYTKEQLNAIYDKI